MVKWAEQARQVETFSANVQTLEAAEASDVARDYGLKASAVADEIFKAHVKALDRDKQAATSSYRSSWWILGTILIAADRRVDLRVLQRAPLRRSAPLDGRRPPHRRDPRRRRVG